MIDFIFYEQWVCPRIEAEPHVTDRSEMIPRFMQIFDID